MRRWVAALAAASVVRSSPHVFSVHDDVLAFPQYEMVFPDEYILEADARSSLSSMSSSSSAKARAASATSTPSDTPKDSEISTRTHDNDLSGQSDAEDSESELPDDYKYMILEDQPYLCAIPQIKKQPRNETQAAISKADEMKELAQAESRGWELLSNMQGKCIYFVSGWWSYSFCYNAKVKQFHQLPPGRNSVPRWPPIEDQEIPSYVLGQFIDPEQRGVEVSRRRPTPSPEILQMQTNGDMRYLVQKLGDGTVCDLTGKPRKIEVQFHCYPHPPDRIWDIRELSTCNYLMIIHTPRLCDEVVFQPPQTDKAHKISCREIIPEEEVEQWKARKAERDTKDLTEVEDLVNSPPPIVVGDIEVGGQKLVGRDGRRIEPPKITQPEDLEGRIVAKWHPDQDDGQVMVVADRDLKKMGIKPDEIHDMKDQLIERSDGQPWRLEVVDYPNGNRELRGIVDTDDPVDEEQYGSQEQYDGYEQYEGGGNAAYEGGPGHEEQRQDDGEKQGSEEVVYHEEL